MIRIDLRGGVKERIVNGNDIWWWMEELRKGVLK